LLRERIVRLTRAHVFKADARTVSGACKLVVSAWAGADVARKKRPSEPQSVDNKEIPVFPLKAEGVRRVSHGVTVARGDMVSQASARFLNHPSVNGYRHSPSSSLRNPIVP
jgi:hypothetical protein